MASILTFNMPLDLGFKPSLSDTPQQRTRLYRVYCVLPVIIKNTFLIRLNQTLVFYEGLLK